MQNFVFFENQIEYTIENRSNKNAATFAQILYTWIKRTKMCSNLFMV